MTKTNTQLFIVRLVLPMILTILFTSFKSKAFTKNSDITAVTRLYVAEGATGDGSSWTNAMGDLSTALNTALLNKAITEIWVKAGTYKPSGQPYNLNLGDARHNAFYLIDGVALLGGFAGNETSAFDRNPGMNPTILSGEIGAPGDADNCYHTVVSVNNAATASMGSFIIRDGNANGTGINTTISGVAVDASSGGGIVQYSSSAGIHTCTFTANKALLGGAIFLSGANTTPRITQCVIAGNTGVNGAGGIYNGINSTAYIRISTIAGNSSTGQGAGILNVQSAPSMEDIIVWGNNGPGLAGIADVNANPYLNASVVQGGHAGTNVLTVDPLLANLPDPDGPDDQWMTADDGLRPLPCSPVINKAYDIDFKPATDVTNGIRVFDTAMDMGAYELQSWRDGTSLGQNGDESFMSVPGGRGAVSRGIGFVVEDCRVIAKFEPVTIPGTTDNVRAKVMVAENAITTSGFHFVPRYYDIKSTLLQVYDVTTTLFYTQTEFDAFNAVAGDTKLPISPTDAIGKANLLLFEYPSNSTDLPIMPEDGTQPKMIDPDDSKIIWNAKLSRWEVSFVSSLYSRFFVTNGQKFPLKLVDFTAKVEEHTTKLEWLTAEEVNTSHFEIHRSMDAHSWEVLSVRPPATGSGGHRYSATDDEPLAGLTYYRLKMIDLDGSFAFSRIITADRFGFQARVFPNPASTRVEIEFANQPGTGSKAELVNLVGTVVWKGWVTGDKTSIEVGRLSKGIYLLRLQGAAGTKTRRVVIE